MTSAASHGISAANKIVCASDDVSSLLGVPIYYQITISRN